MIETRTGNMLEEVTEGFMMQGCNAQGEMGAGIALAIRNKWPIVYDEYMRAWDNGHPLPIHGTSTTIHLQELEMGSIIPVRVTPDIIMINAITQRFYTGHAFSDGGREVDYEAVAQACESINNLVLSTVVMEVLHFPLIGAGLAKGNWDIIASIIDETIDRVEKVLWVLPE